MSQWNEHDFISLIQLVGIILGSILACYLAIEFGIPLYAKYMRAIGISSDCILSKDPQMCEQIKAIRSNYERR